MHLFNSHQQETIVCAGVSKRWCGACNWMPYHKEPSGFSHECHCCAWQAVPKAQVCTKETKGTVYGV